MTTQPTVFRTPAPQGAERWEFSGQHPAHGWVDLGRGVGRIDSGLEASDPAGRGCALLDHLGRRYPGVRWFSDRAA